VIYTTTDVICCFPGIGRTTFSEENKHEGSTFALDLDYDGTNLKAFIDRVKAEREKKAHRYILVPMDAEILMALRESNIAHITVVPSYDEFNEWAVRWMHSGATAEMIIARKKRWREIDGYSDRSVWSSEACVIRLGTGEWLGNVLEQAPATQDERKDVGA